MNRDAYYFFAGLFVFFVFGLKLDLLLKRTTFKVVLTIATMLFAVGLVLHFTAEASHSAAGALLAPLPMVGYFWLLHKFFVRWVNREPIDTAMNWTPGLVKDRTFAFAFLFGSVLIIFVLTIGAERLAKVGW